MWSRASITGTTPWCASSRTASPPRRRSSFARPEDRSCPQACRSQSGPVVPSSPGPADSPSPAAGPSPVRDADVHKLGPSIYWVSARDIHSHGGRVSTTQIELDPKLLAEAAAVLGTRTKKETVNEALRRVVQDEIRRQHLDELASGELPDL